MILSTEIIEQARLTEFGVSWHGGYDAEPRTNTLDEIIGDSSSSFADRDVGFSFDDEFLYDLCDLNIGEEAIYKDMSGEVRFTKLTHGKNG
tara:strand:+ start:465 stop:737 length:273 start_codon:yes stop_codon:yes gene_type:complete